MFDKRQFELFNKGYGAYRRIIKKIIENVEILDPKKKDSSHVLLMLAEIEIQKILLDISLCDEKVPTEEEQLYIKSIIESSDALYKLIPGSRKFYRNMTPADYHIVKSKFDELSYDIPLALIIAIELEKKGEICFEDILQDYRLIFDSFSDISGFDEPKQNSKIGDWMYKFVTYAREQGVNISTDLKEIEDQEILIRDKRLLEDTSCHKNENSSISDDNESNESLLIKIEQQMSDKWVGTYKDIHSLTVAFLHRFVAGGNAVFKPKTNIVILGTESRGRLFAVQMMGKILWQNNLIKNSGVSVINFADYPLGTENIVFLSDLYRALYQSTDIIVFDNLERADSKHINALYQLMSHGIYHLEQRYIEKMGILYPATGVLSTDIISEIHANDKIFVLISALPQTQILDFLGEKIISEVSDIVNIDPMGKAEVDRLAQLLCAKLADVCERELHLRIEIDDLLIEQISEIFDNKTGAAGIERYLKNQVYNPLINICLSGRLVNNQKVLLTFDDNEFWVEDEKHYGISLSEYARPLNELELNVVKRELSGVIGLDKVKDYIYSLEDKLIVNRLRNRKGLKTSSISMNMIFTGNPGTGKTTMARIVARYLKALGYLSSGQIREVTRSDLVSQYVGYTALKTTEVIKSSIGGVLFIDEAYSLYRGINDEYGREAVDALVKGIEDNSDNLVVILAGYTEEMEEFIQANPGIKSRFPNVIQFDDYSSLEMWTIAKAIAADKGYIISDSCYVPIIELFERHQIKGRYDSGNGRLARNIVDSAILLQSQRVVKDPTQDLEVLIPEDFGFMEKQKFDLEESFLDIVGLDNVKEIVRTQYKLQQANILRKKMGINVDTSQSLNMIFVGSPGTGKTTIARLVARMFHELGVLKSGHLVETDKGGLISQYMGQTAKKTEAVFKSALGGVLFIDEAYAITNEKNSYGQECIDTLVKLIEDYRGETLVILAGYTSEMKEFMKTNSGLKSRFSWVVEFPDYNVSELCEIAKKMIISKGFKLSEDGELALVEEISNQKRTASENSGNGRLARNIVEKIIRKQSVRIVDGELSAEELSTIIAQDVYNDTFHKEYDVDEDFRNIIGLENVKHFVKGLNARLKIQAERKKVGLKTNNTQTLHMIFAGSPGTGKTMMARIIANILYNVGIINTNKLIETDRAGLVAGYVGQTAIKTRQIIESALDGVLFIDEAYSLLQGGENDYGKETVNILVKMMDDYRDRLVVILAGYRNDMNQFLEMNPGLKSRFANIIDFPDYSVDELMLIAKKMYEEEGYQLSEEAYYELERLFTQAKKRPAFGNGRFVRNIFEKTCNAQAV